MHHDSVIDAMWKGMTQPPGARIRVSPDYPVNHTLDNGLAYHGKRLINWGYLRKETLNGRDSGQQSLILGGLHDGVPTAHAELGAQMVNVAAHGVRGNHQGFSNFFVGETFG
jgi:hypothetical protein